MLLQPSLTASHVMLSLTFCSCCCHAMMAAAADLKRVLLDTTIGDQTKLSGAEYADVQLLRGSS